MSNSEIEQKNSEEWRKIPFSHVEAYASSWGRIKCNGVIIKQSPRVRDYLGVSLKRKRYLVNRLVCMAFHGLPPAGKNEAMHLDNDAQNNTPENLAWGSHTENMKMDRGNNHSHAGAANKNSKLTEEIVKEIRDAYDNRLTGSWGRRALAEKFGISEAHCGRIALRKSGGWQHLE
jgi:hypothetical protein